MVVRVSFNWKGWLDIWNLLKIELLQLYFGHLARCPLVKLGKVTVYIFLLRDCAL